jgi:hypothetical protein
MVAIWSLQRIFSKDSVLKPIFVSIGNGEGVPNEETFVLRVPRARLLC